MRIAQGRGEGALEVVRVDEVGGERGEGTAEDVPALRGFRGGTGTGVMR